MDNAFLTSMMKTHVQLMQKQLQDGFGHIADKMNALEGKLAENDSKLKRFNTSQAKESQQKEQAD